MKKLLKGIKAFRGQAQAPYCVSFAALATRHEPDALMLTCGDSRVVPNMFASTDPGDLFVIRNVGNILPPPLMPSSERVALEFAISTLKVRDLIICGHSECAAMAALLSGEATPHLKDWLQWVEGVRLSASSCDVNRYSQLNVCFQLEQLRKFDFVQKAIEEGRIRVHGWWFDLKTADVYRWVPEEERFLVLDEAQIDILLEKLEKEA